MGFIEEELKTCPYCGKKQVWYEKKAGSFHIKVPVYQCNCKDIEQEKIKKQKELKKLEQLREKRRQELFTNSLMTPFFKEKIFEKLNNNSNLNQCKEYAKTFSPEKSKGIRMIGNIGTGKTTLLAAICNNLIEQGYKCLFTTFSDLLSKFSNYSSNNAGDISEQLHWLTTFDFVCLDDIGRETYTDKRKEIAFILIDTLMNYKVVTAFTANPEMLEKLKQIPEMNAALDRLKDMCPIKYEFKGKSLRGGIQNSGKI